MNSRAMARSLMLFAAGALAGLGFRQCRPVDHGAPGNSVAIPSGGPQQVSAAPDPAKIRAAARVWFDANQRKTPPAYYNYELIESPPTREIDQIESLTSADLREWLEEGRANSAEGRLMDLLMERWGEVDLPAFVAWIEFLAKQPRPRHGHQNFSFRSFFPDPNPPWFTAACAVLKRMDPTAKIPLRHDNPWAAHPGVPQIPFPTTQPSDLRPAPPQPDLYALSAEAAIDELARQNFGMHEISNIAQRLAQKDHRAALAWAQGIPKNIRERHHAIKLAILKGAEDGPWILENAPLLKREDDIKYAITNSAALYGSQKGRASVMDWLLQRTEPAERRGGLGMLADRMYNMDIPEATGLLSRLTDRAERSRFLEAMLSTFGDEKEAGQFLALIAAEPGTGKESLGAGAAAFHLAEQKSVSEAIAWADTLPDDGRRAAGLAAAYAVWTRREPDVALRAARALPPGEVHTAVCTQAAIARAEGDPIAALRFSQSLGMEARAAIFPQLADKLRRHQGEAARAEAAHLLTQRPTLAEDAAFSHAVRQFMPDTSTPTGARTAREWLSRLPVGELRAGMEAEIPSAP